MKLTDYQDDIKVQKLRVAHQAYALALDLLPAWHGDTREAISMQANTSYYIYWHLKADPNNNAAHVAWNLVDYFQFGNYDGIDGTGNYDILQDFLDLDFEQKRFATAVASVSGCFGNDWSDCSSQAGSVVEVTIEIENWTAKDRNMLEYISQLAEDAGLEVHFSTDHSTPGFWLA